MFFLVFSTKGYIAHLHGADKIFESTNPSIFIILGFLFPFLCWTLDVSRTASYEITLVCLSVTKVSYDWIIRFF